MVNYGRSGMIEIGCSCLCQSMDLGNYDDENTLCDRTDHFHECGLVGLIYKVQRIVWIPFFTDFSQNSEFYHGRWAKISALTGQE